MGRQIHFYMLPEDRKAFLQYVQEHDSTTVAARDSDMAKVEPVDSLDEPVNTLCLWKTTLAPALQRNWVPDPGYFRLDTLHKPILEFVPSFNATWEGKPALGQGRLFGNFESYLGKPLEFEQCHGRLTRWIRNNYRKNGARFGGYIGPAAHEF